MRIPRDVWQPVPSSSGRRDPTQVIAHELEATSLACVPSTLGKRCEIRPLPRPHERPDDEPSGAQGRIDLSIGAG